MKSGFLIAVIALGSILSIAVWAVDGGSVKYISITGKIDDRQEQVVKQAVANFDINARDLAELKSHIEKIDWIHHVNVMKDWPSGVTVEVFPEQVIAYWNDDAFINESGVVFYTAFLMGGNLPHLYGPVGGEHEVMNRYQQLSRTLARASQAIEVLRLNERGAWEFETNSKVKVILGRDDVLNRLERYLKVMAKIGSDVDGSAKRVTRVDTRYQGGVAVHFADESVTDELKMAELTKAKSTIGREGSL